MQANKPTTPTTTPVRQQPPTGRALGSMAAALLRGVTRVDRHLFKVLDAGYAAPERDAARLEASLLLRLRRGLNPYLREPASAGAAPERMDGVLADGLLEAVEAALAVVADLEGEAPLRQARWLAYCHELISELVALGAGPVVAEKQRAEQLALRLRGKQASVPAALDRELAQFYVALSERLEHTSPLKQPTLLDELLRGAPGLSPKPPVR